MRPHPLGQKANGWDDSNGYSISERPGINLNLLHKDAFRKLSQSTASQTLQPKAELLSKPDGIPEVRNTDKGRQPSTVDGLRTPSTTDVPRDEVKAEIHDSEVAKPKQEYVPPHLRVPTNIVPAQVVVPSDNPLTPNSSAAEHKPEASPISTATVQKNGIVPSEIAATKRKHDPFTVFPTQARGWEKAAASQKVSAWNDNQSNHTKQREGRSSPSVSPEQKSKDLESWNQKKQVIAAEETVFIDITSPAFASGEGVINDGSISDPISEEAHRTHRLPNDPMTAARADQTAQSRIDVFRANSSDATPEKQLSKGERRQMREALRARDLEFAKLPNPYKPAADIYIRPALPKDLQQITDIYNYYIKTSAIALELDELTRDVWTMRMDDCRDEGYEMYVAVQKAAGGMGHARRDAREPVFGFAYAEDQNDKRSSCRFTAVVQVYVDFRHLRMGVGRCLLDRIMALLNPNHYLKKGIDWVGDEPMIRRNLKKVMIEIPYWDDHEEEKAICWMRKDDQAGTMHREAGWKSAFLNGIRFEHVGTIPGIGFKKGTLEKGKS